MERYLLVPDSFKGTLSSQEICNILREEILRVRPEAEVLAFPVADGGEGSVDAFLAAVGGERIPPNAPLFWVRQYGFAEMSL